MYFIENNFHIPSAELIRLYDPKSVDIEGEIAIICLRLVKTTIISVTALLKVKLFDQVLITSRKI